MTRIYTTCKIKLGEKCRICGSTEVQEVIRQKHRRPTHGYTICRQLFPEGTVAENRPPNDTRGAPKRRSENQA